VIQGLTRRQHEIFLFLRSYFEEHGYAPSYREIMEHFNLASLGSVYAYIKILIEKNVVSMKKGSSRGLVLTEEITKKDTSANLLELPLIGTLSAGSPIELFSESLSVNVPKTLCQAAEGDYVFRIAGDGFSEEYLQNGDLLIVHAQEEAEDGATIVFLVNEQDVMIKRYFLEGSYLRLESFNRSIHPIILRHEDVMIQGIVKGMLRQY
jgi:repressor LexA